MHKYIQGAYILLPRYIHAYMHAYMHTYTCRCCLSVCICVSLLLDSWCVIWYAYLGLCRRVSMRVCQMTSKRVYASARTCAKVQVHVRTRERACVWLHNVRHSNYFSRLQDLGYTDKSIPSTSYIQQLFWTLLTNHMHTHTHTRSPLHPPAHTHKHTHKHTHTLSTAQWI